MNLWKQIKISIYGFDIYDKLTEIRPFKICIYAFILFNILFFSVCGSSIFNYVANDGAAGIISEYIPNFKISNGILNMNEKINITANGGIIIVDTKKNFDENNALLYPNAILIDSEKIIVKNFSNTSTVKFSDFDSAFSELFNKPSFTKNDLYNLSSTINILMTLSMFLLYILWALSYMISLLFFAACAYIINRIIRANLNFGTLMKIVVYAGTLPAIIDLLMSIFGFYITGLTSILWLVYIFIATRSIKKSREVI